MYFTFRITSILIYNLTLFVVAFLLHKCFFIITFYYISFSLKKILHTELKTRWYPLQQKEVLCTLKSLFYSLNCFLHCSKQVKFCRIKSDIFHLKLNTITYFSFWKFDLKCIFYITILWHHWTSIFYWNIISIEMCINAYWNKS